MSQAVPRYLVDPLDPRAPSQAVSDQLSPEERRSVLDALPSEFQRAELLKPTRIPAGRTAPVGLSGSISGDYVAASISRASCRSITPTNRCFAPDLLTVLAVEPHERDHWICKS